MNILITGGRYPRNWEKIQKSNGENFIRFYTGEIILLNWDTLKIEKTIQYESPRQVLNPSMMFKFGEIDKNFLNIVTNTELVVYDLNDWTIIKRVSFPSFNDLHSVMKNSDSYFIVNTGLEIIQEIDINSNLVNEYNFASKKTWDRFDINFDYRKIGSTKPHEIHINHIFSVNGDFYVTRMLKQDAVSLTDKNNFFSIDAGNPHDGIVHNDQVFFTTTNGHIVVFDSKTRAQLKCINLRDVLSKSNMAPDGWCRGILPFGKNRAFVGFTQLRSTKFNEFASWVKNIGKNASPSRIVEIDLDKELAIKEYIIPGKNGMAVFSILNHPL